VTRPTDWTTRTV